MQPGEDFTYSGGIASAKSAVLCDSSTLPFSRAAAASEICFLHRRSADAAACDDAPRKQHDQRYETRAIAYICLTIIDVNHFKLPLL